MPRTLPPEYLPFLLGSRQLARRRQRGGRPGPGRGCPRGALHTASRGHILRALGDGLCRNAESLGVVLGRGLVGVEPKDAPQDGRGQGVVAHDNLRVGGARFAEVSGDTDVGDAIRGDGGGVQAAVFILYGRTVVLRQEGADGFEWDARARGRRGDGARGETIIKVLMGTPSQVRNEAGTAHRLFVEFLQ